MQNSHKSKSLLQYNSPAAAFPQKIEILLGQLNNAVIQVSPFLPYWNKDFDPIWARSIMLGGYKSLILYGCRVHKSSDRPIMTLFWFHTSRANRTIYLQGILNRFLHQPSTDLSLTPWVTRSISPLNPQHSQAHLRPTFHKPPLPDATQWLTSSLSTALEVAHPLLGQLHPRILIGWVNIFLKSFHKQEFWHSATIHSPYGLLNRPEALKALFLVSSRNSLVWDAIQRPYGTLTLIIAYH